MNESKGKVLDVLAIVSLSFVSCVVLFIVEQWIGASYLVKTGTKIVLFLIVPLVYIKFMRGKSIRQFLNVKTFDWKQVRLGLFLGILSMGVVLSAFFLFQPWIEPDAIVDDLQTRLEITPDIFPWIALYITFGNSLLEEFYFRGFLFLQLYRKKWKRFAYLYSPLLFSVYHVAIFALWFDFWLLLLALVGLWIVGLILNWLNAKADHFLNSWILHILADTGVMIIGFYLFGLF
ncbi:CPBP family intramembrane glutamic endopeptidase [Fervidibacillus albus]|uniref:CPBP family intramembrane metalloprotease n=1 Tax=Fervidibacillus albus TaxID=2980026 RepID=A0A9E8LWQ1_9BACI|nr:CPBP family intramembrane glutamic endopeptidase [Fervidibacillus albus]WAA10496.1 CPBP family intramembrane metalloprotease [Fervidibacillus albus]